MAKDKLTDYSATNGSNTDVGGINIDEGMLPSAVNNSIRELMTHQKEAFGSGTPLYVDQTNNRVGVGNSAPSTALEVDADGATVLTLDRATSDGTVMELQKGGTAFGRMSVSDANNLSIDCTTTDHAGLTFATENILPRKNSANTDNAVDLGAGSARFKDAYLSGNLYLGGTGSANALDDYEEGTWTPADASPASLSITVQSAFYRKVGSLVAVQAYIIYPTTSNTNNATLGGLPFAGIGGAGSYGAFAVGFSDYSTMFQILRLASSSTTMDFRVAGGQNVLNSNFSGKSIIFSGVYVSA